MKRKNWYLLDNAALIFPCTANKNRPNMFCVSAFLVEDINQAILQETIDQVLKFRDDRKYCLDFLVIK